MRGRVLGFVEPLREHDIPVSVAETMDAVAAVAATGIERRVLREALAATLVKDEHDRPVFDECFERAFPLAPAPRRRARAGSPRAGGEETGLGGGSGEGRGGGR